MIDRRAFVAGATLAPFFPVCELAAQVSASTAAAESRVVFMIDGWSEPNDDEAMDQVWIKIGHGWRTPWR